MWSNKKSNGNEEVSRFLATSYEFKRLQEIAKANPWNQRYASWIKCISECSSLDYILYHTGEIDPATTDNIVAYNLGRNTVNAALYVTGFFSNNSSFTYYLLHLRENVQSFLIANRQETMNHFSTNYSSHNE